MSYPLLFTLSRFQVPISKVEQNLSFWETHQKNTHQSTSDKTTSGTWHLLPALSPLYLFQKRTQGTNKPFSLIFCSTLNVLQVANNVQLFPPRAGLQQDCESGMYVRVLAGCSLGSRSWQTSGLENTAELKAVGEPGAQQSQPWANHLLTPLKCLEGNVLRGDGFHPRTSAYFQHFF